MFSKLLSNRRLWILISLVLLPRLLLLVFAKSLSGDDGERYLLEGINVHDFATFSHEHGPYPAPTAFDLPLYPFLLASLISIFGHISLVVRVAAALNAVFFTIAAIGVYGLGYLLRGSRRIGEIAMVTFAFFPETFPYSLFFMPDSAFLAVFLWSVLLLTAFLVSSEKRWLLSGFALLGVSVLLKPVSLFFAGLYAGLALLFWPSKLQRWHNRAAWVALGLLLEGAVLAPWVIRNYRDFESPVVSTMMGTNLFNEHYRMLLEDLQIPGVEKVQANIRAKAARSAGAAWSNPVEQSRIVGAIAERAIKDHWRSYAATTLKRHARLYVGTGAIATFRLLGASDDVSAVETWQKTPSISTMKDLPPVALVVQTLSWVVLGFVYFVAVWGIIVLVRSRSLLTLSLTLSTLAYMALLIGPMVNTRYRMPMAAFLSLLCASGLNWMWTRFVNRSSP